MKIKAVRISNFRSIATAEFDAFGFNFFAGQYTFEKIEKKKDAQIIRLQVDCSERGRKTKSEDIRSRESLTDPDWPLIKPFIFRGPVV